MSETEQDQLRRTIAEKLASVDKMRDDIHRALYPVNLTDTRKYRRIEEIDQDGTRWRGILYAVESE